MIAGVSFDYHFVVTRMQDCWQEDPDDRPTFENLSNQLKEMENQHQVTCEHSLSGLKFPIPFFSVVVMRSRGGLGKFHALKKGIFLVDDLGDFLS